MTLRVSVAFGIAFLTFLGIVALAGPRWPDGARSHQGDHPERRRLASIAFGLAFAGIGLQFAGSGSWAAVALDCLPGIYLLAGYWLPGQLPHRPAPRLEAQLEATDRLVFESGVAPLLERAPRLFLEYLEAAYLCCYVLVPAGLAWLYLAGRRREADAFWTAVLLAALPCYALVKWFATRPPRSIERHPLTRPRHVTLRRLNLVVLDGASNGLNTFPSGHTAASFAVALSVGTVAPAAGVVFGVLALSIAVASVAGRYHYALDALTGVLAALAAFGVTRLLHAFLPALL